MPHRPPHLNAAGLLRTAIALGTALLAGAALAAEAPDLSFQAPQASWALDLGSTGYAFQSEDPAGNSTDHFRFLQSFSGTATGLAGGVLSFRAAGRFANDPVVAYPGFENSRLYTGYAEARLGRRVRARLGRMFLQSGATGLTLDGLWARWRPDRMVELSAWGGRNAPFGTGFAWSNPDSDEAYGGRVALRLARIHRLSFSGAYRERHGRVASRPLGLEYTVTPSRRLRALARAVYDDESGEWNRLEAQAQWRGRRGQPVAGIQFVDRRQVIDPTSWFGRFTDLKRISLLRAGVSWRSETDYGGELEYVGSFVGDRASNRLGAAVLVPIGRVGYSARMGDQGDQSTIYGEIGWTAVRWLRLEAEASYLTYALFADAPTADERDLTTLAGRLRARLRPGLNLTAEVQALRNPLYDSDVRFLVGVDVAMARGTSRLGLDRGGWLR